jgi:uroporphyrinogen-III synthase
MKIKNILISQFSPADYEKSPYAELTKKYSVNIDFYKLFRIENVSGLEFRKSKVNILNHDAVIFSSKNTVDQFFYLIKDLRIEIPESMKYFCTTEAVALYLQKYIQFRKRKIFYVKNSNPNGVFELFMKNKEYKYLIPCGSDSMGTQYVDFFAKNEIQFTKAVIFNIIPSDIKSDIDITKYDMIVFFSPSGVQAFHSNFPEFVQGDIVFAALGPTTASVFESYGWNLQVVAPTKEAPSITAAIDLFLKDHATRKR